MRGKEAIMAYTINDLAKLVGCSKNTVARRLHLMGITAQMNTLNGQKTRVVKLNNNEVLSLKNTINSNKGVTVQAEHPMNTLNADIVQRLENTLRERENELHKKEMQIVQLDADLKVARSDIKLITDKSNDLTAAYSEQRQINERMQITLKRCNTALIILGAAFLVAMSFIIFSLILK